MKCTSCKAEIPISDWNYEQLLVLYRKLYETKKDQGDTTEVRNDILNYIGNCPNCGANYREYMCQARHLCTTLKNCPICGSEAPLIC